MDITHRLEKTEIEIGFGKETKGQFENYLCVEYSENGRDFNFLYLGDERIVDEAEAERKIRGLGYDPFDLYNKLFNAI